MREITSWRKSSRFGPDAERLLDLGHHVLVGILEPAGERVAQLLLLGPVRDVRDVACRRGRAYCRSSTSPIDERTSSSTMIEEPLAHDVDELLVLVVAAGQRLLLQELVDGDVLDQLLHLLEHGERRDAVVARCSARRSAAASSSRAGSRRCGPRSSDRRRDSPRSFDVAERAPWSLGREPVGRAAVRVELGLLERRQLADQLGQRSRILLGLRLAHARQHRPQRGDVRGVRRDVPPDRAVVRSAPVDLAAPRA